MIIKTYTPPLTAALLLTLSASAVADDKPTKDKLFVLDRITVAATRTEQKLQDVASSVSVIDEQTLEKNQSSNIRDMVRYEPGVQVGNATGDGARFGSKGFTIRGMDENRVKIIVDGVDQPNAFTPSGSPFQRSGRNFVDIDSLKRIEIVKGPASTLYGSDALGGIVAYTTKDPADYLKDGDNTGGSIKFHYGSADKQLAQTLTLANRNGKLESLLVYTHRDAEELKNFDDGYTGGTGADRTRKDPVDYGSDNFLAKLQYQLSDNHRLGLTLENFDSETDTNLQSKLSGSYSSHYLGDDSTERQRISLFHDWQANLALFDKVHWQLDWQNSESQQITDTIYRGDLRTKDYKHEEETRQFSAQFDKTFGIHQLTYGLSYLETDLTNITDTIYPNAPSRTTLDRYVPLVEGRDYSVYLQDQISLMEGKLLLTPGIRYDNFEAKPQTDNRYSPVSVIDQVLTDHSSDKVTARLGAVYKLTDSYALFGQYSQGFKAPDLIDMYYASYRDYRAFGSGEFLTLPNPDLEPEKSDSFELGFRINNAVGNLEITAFYNEYEDFIDSVTVDSTYGGITYASVSQSQNIDEVTIKGLELRAALWLDQAFSAPQGSSLQVSVAYADGENETNNEPLESIAPLSAVIGLAYDAPNDSWGSALNWTLVDNKSKSDLADDDTFATPGYGIVDLSAYYQINPNLIIRGGVYNLGDKEYWVYEDVRQLEADENLERYTQPGRNFTASIKYSF